MAILKIARMGHPVLRARARTIDRGELKSIAVQRLIDDMLETMVEYRGVGLAAPQVHERVRIFVATIDAADETSPPAKPIVVINPEVMPVGDEVAEDWEGCLSVPDIRGRVPRAREIRLRALDRRGERFDMPAQDFTARVFQHETDHLDGILFIDRLDPETRKEAMKALRDQDFGMSPPPRKPRKDL